MTDRVYPTDSPPVSGEHSRLKPFIETPPVSGEHSTLKPLVETPPVSGEHQRRMSQDSFASSKMSGYNYGYGPNPGTYVVQIPKDQVYRVPPPENTHKYHLYTKKKARKNCCRRCFCCTLAIILILAILLGATIGILYLILNPKAPTFSIQNISVTGVNFALPASAATTFSPVFNVTLKAVNPNGKIGIYYEQGSDISITHDGVDLCDGKLPAFYQPANSVTVFSTKLSGAGIVLSKSARDKLLMETRSKKVPLELDVNVPFKIKVGSLTSWTFSVDVKCDVTLDALMASAKVVSKRCEVHGKPW